MAVFSRRRPGQPRISVWRNGIWTTRLGGVLGAFVVILAFVNLPMLLTPVVVAISGASASLGLAGIYLCLTGLSRRSSRFRSLGFWTSLAGAAVLLVTLGFFYRQALRHQPTRDSKSRLDDMQG